MEPALVSDDLPDDPRRGRAAHDEKDVLAARGPAVPEVLQRGHEVRARRVEPRHLVDEHDLPAGGTALQQALQLLERGIPVPERRTVPEPERAQRRAELPELDRERSPGQARVNERERFGERLLHEERLADAAPSVHGDKFRAGRLRGVQQFILFFLPAQHFGVPFFLFVVERSRNLL